MGEEHDLDALVRRVDPDRWLAARFIDQADKRADILTLYAFNHELARAADVSRQPVLGEIRLTWWREAVAETYRGRTVRRHPTVEGLALAVERQGWAESELQALIDARSDELEAPPMHEERFYEAVDADAGALMLLSARTLEADARADAVRGAARAWGIAGRTRARPPAAAAGFPRLRCAGRGAPR